MQHPDVIGAPPGMSHKGVPGKVSFIRLQAGKKVTIISRLFLPRNQEMKHVVVPSVLAVHVDRVLILHRLCCRTHPPQNSVHLCFSPFFVVLLVLILNRFWRTAGRTRTVLRAIWVCASQLEHPSP